MIKFWRQGAALLLAGVMAASLAACGSTSTGSTGNSDNAGASNEGASAENTGGSENNGEIVKLVVWGVGSADTEDCNEVAAAISEVPARKSVLKSSLSAVRTQNRSIWLLRPVNPSIC
ncbi:MAG: hypothetical protein ACLVAW_04845 [Eisenbergiella massiliensis]